MTAAGQYKHGMDLTGKVAIVTGASMGIGEAIARALAEHGATVVLVSRDASRAEQARQRVGHPDRTLALACDVRRGEEIERAVGLAIEHFHRLDIWVNNAGHGQFDTVAGSDLAACRDTFETNFFGTLIAMQAVVRVMKRQGSGTIINISSVAGHIPLPFHAIYSATKFAMNALGKAARVELEGTGIQVMTVCPGYVRTAFGGNAIRGGSVKTVRPSGTRGITAERVARAVVRGYTRGKRELVVPWTMHPVIKLYQLFPALVEWGMSRMARSGE